MHLRTVPILIAGLAFACATSNVPRTNSRAELQSYVERAARLVEQRGAGACPAFSRAEWMSGEYYIFVTDARTHATVCHPVRPELIGQNQENLQDTAGKYFIREMLDVASGPGRAGWVEYLWPRPGESASTPKQAYVVAVSAPDGNEYVVGSGAYVSEP